MEGKILLSHGSGGRLSHDLVEKHLVDILSNPLLCELDDSATFEISGRVAFSTDSYVVNPIFFAGGDIGKLAVCGTVNDLSMSGAVPLYLSLSLIIEEGFPMNQLNRIMTSIKTISDEAGVQVVTGDTKVVDHGNADKIFINTAGIGLVPEGVNISGSNARAGDKVILSGTIGDHEIAIVSQREGLNFETSLKSDCAPLNHLVADMIEASRDIRCFRDPTRGGLASSLNELAGQSKVGIRIEEARIPVDETVKAGCEFLGFDPLYLANEGKLVAVVPAKDTAAVLARMRQNKFGVQAEVIGEIVAEHPGRVVMTTRFGTSRVVDMLSGELLPRIC
ncbi:MAG: hydrogenase expression/formation protein HypE [Deltaproteobacteria bacterium]|nr:hydrogenase expression/formation protein HypE [Deltaproteobacteria bacterium]